MVRIGARHSGRGEPIRWTMCRGSAMSLLLAVQDEILWCLGMVLQFQTCICELGSVDSHGPRDRANLCGRFQARHGPAVGLFLPYLLKRQVWRRV